MYAYTVTFKQTNYVILFKLVEFGLGLEEQTCLGQILLELCVVGLLVPPPTQGARYHAQKIFIFVNIYSHRPNPRLGYMVIQLQHKNVQATT